MWAVRRYCGVATPCDSAGIMASTAASLLTGANPPHFPPSLYDDGGRKHRPVRARLLFFAFSLRFSCRLYRSHYCYAIIVINQLWSCKNNAEENFFNLTLSLIRACTHREYRSVCRNDIKYSTKQTTKIVKSKKASTSQNTGCSCMSFLYLNLKKTSKRFNPQLRSSSVDFVNLKKKYTQISNILARTACLLFTISSITSISSNFKRPKRLRKLLLSY